MEEDLYRDIILDHFKNPRNRGTLTEPDIEAKGTNPFCGDELEMDIKIKEGRVAAVGIVSRGCAVSQASASMLAALMEGKTVQELLSSIGIFRGKMLGGKEAPWPKDWQDLEALEGVKKYPVRIKCALLAWNTLHQGLKEYETKGSIEKVNSRHKEEA